MSVEIAHLHYNNFPRTTEELPYVRKPQSETMVIQGKCLSPIIYISVLQPEITPPINSVLDSVFFIKFFWKAAISSHETLWGHAWHTSDKSHNGYINRKVHLIYRHRVGCFICITPWNPCNYSVTDNILLFLRWWNCESEILSHLPQVT